MIKMTTGEKLREYHHLQKVSSEAASEFLYQNRDDQRFVSLVELGNELIEGFREYLLETMRKSHEVD